VRQRNQWDLYLEQRVLQFRGACWRCKWRIAAWWLWQAMFGPRHLRRLRRLILMSAWQDRRRLRELDVPLEWIH
jgi:hypothetical protein